MMRHLDYAFGWGSNRMEDAIYRVVKIIFEEQADIAVKWALTFLATAGAGIFTWLGRRRVQQEEEKHRETHTLNLFEALSQSNPHLQLAVASVLVERLRRLIDAKRKQQWIFPSRLRSSMLFTQC